MTAPCPECGATGRWGPCAQLFMVLLSLDHERREPWGAYHTVNVACYLLQHPTRTNARVAAGQRAVIDAFLSGGLGAVHRLTEHAVRHNRGPGRAAPVAPAVPRLVRRPATTIEDVALAGSFPAAGYEERVLQWARATVEALD